MPARVRLAIGLTIGAAKIGSCVGRVGRVRRIQNANCIREWLTTATNLLPGVKRAVCRLTVIAGVVRIGDEDIRLFNLVHEVVGCRAWVTDAEQLRYAGTIAFWGGSRHIFDNAQ